MIGVIAASASGTVIPGTAYAKLTGCVGRRVYNILNEAVWVEFMSMAKSEPL